VSVQAGTAMSMDEWFCGRAINSGIESRYPLGASTVFFTDRHRITSIAVVTHERHTVAVLGTSTGHLLKVSTGAVSFLGGFSPSQWVQFYPKIFG